MTALVEERGQTILYFNGQPIRSWKQSDYPNFHCIKWYGSNQIVAWRDEEFEAVLISAEAWQRLSLGPIDHLYLSQHYIFCGYDIDTAQSGHPDGPCYIGDYVAAFTRTGDYFVGARQFLWKASDPIITYLSGGYVFEDRFNFISDEMIFRFDPSLMKLDYFKARFSEPFSISGAKIFAGNEGKAYAIHDNRLLKTHHPDRPDFEFATFDLAAQTGSKADFAVVENALVAAGFDIAEVKFQQNSVGKTIVSDSKKAALLEISDYL